MSKRKGIPEEYTSNAFCTWCMILSFNVVAYHVLKK